MGIRLPSRRMPPAAHRIPPCRCTAQLAADYSHCHRPQPVCRETAPRVISSPGTGPSPNAANNIVANWGPVSQHGLAQEGVAAIRRRIAALRWQLSVPDPLCRPEDRKLALFARLSLVPTVLPAAAGAGKIGFVWRDGLHRRRRQPCRPLPLPVRAGIGFVSPRPWACPICHNSCPAKHLPGQLASFRTLWPGGGGMGHDPGPRPFYRLAGNWLRLARWPPGRQCFRTGRAATLAASAGRIGFV